MKRLLFALPILVFVGIIVAFGFALQRDPARLPSMLIDKPLPQFALPAVRANDVGLATNDLRGRPMLLNVFASWCVSCRVEHPVLLELKAEGVPIAGLDWKDKAVDGAQYLHDNGDPYGKAGNDSTGRAGIDLGVTGVPETFIVDRFGKVRYKQVGPIGPDDWKNTIKPLMDKLAAS